MKKTDFKSFYLDVSSEHSLYIEDHGNPIGKVFIFLHGGPGGSFDESNLRWFDLSIHRVILFEQRGCNRSRGNFFVNNTTEELINDIEKIRTHLNINKFSIFGGSWGSCLALAYSIKHPSKVVRYCNLGASARK
jgi:proline iminopeptidase